MATQTEEIRPTVLSSLELEFMQVMKDWGHYATAVGLRVPTQGEFDAAIERRIRHEVDAGQPFELN